MTDMPRILEINDININNIAYILSTAGLSGVDTNDDREVWVISDSAMPMKIEIDEKNKMLKFQSSFGLNKSSPISEKYKLTNELNRALLVRFYLDIDDIVDLLVGEYYLTYEHGILTNQLIITCELFQYIFTGVLREKYIEGGVLDPSANKYV